MSDEQDRIPKGCVYNLLSNATCARGSFRCDRKHRSEIKPAVVGNFYGLPLAVKVEQGRLVIEIGIHTLAHAAAFSDWANPFDEKRDDYIRNFAITDPEQFAQDVMHAMLAEREDGSSPLSDFLDEMMQAAISDGSLGLHEDEQAIKHGTFSPLETWAAEASDVAPTPPQAEQ